MFKLFDQWFGIEENGFSFFSKREKPCVIID